MRSCVSRSVLPVRGFQAPARGQCRRPLPSVVAIEESDWKICSSSWVVLPRWQRALDAVDIALVGEGQAHLCGAGLGVDQRIIALARLTEERPGNGIQERRFSRAVCPGNASQLESGEIQLGALTVG